MKSKRRRSCLLWSRDTSSEAFPLFKTRPLFLFLTLFPSSSSWCRTRLSLFCYGLLLSCTALTCRGGRAVQSIATFKAAIFDDDQKPLSYCFLGRQSEGMYGLNRAPLLRLNIVQRSEVCWSGQTARGVIVEGLFCRYANNQPSNQAYLIFCRLWITVPDPFQWIRSACYVDDKLSKDPALRKSVESRYQWDAMRWTYVDGWMNATSVLHGEFLSTTHQLKSSQSSQFSWLINDICHVPL